MAIKLRCDDTINFYSSGVHVVIELTAGAGRSVALSSPAQARLIAAELNRLADEVEGSDTTESLHRRVAKLEAAICDLKARGDLAREAKATKSTGSPYDLSLKRRKP